MGDLAASTRLRRVSARDSLSPGPSSLNQRSARQRVTQDTTANASPGSTSNGTRQIVLRRVHAVVEVPVKEESVERDGMGLATHLSPPNTASTSTSASKSTSAPKTPKAPLTVELGKATSRIKRKASAKRTYVEIDDAESEQDSVSHDPKQSDAREYQPVSDGDDELLMGIEVGNTSSVEGSER